jgi:Cu/Ag efflux protein CusF
MQRLSLLLISATAVAVGGLISLDRLAQAQPARGAQAAVAQVRENVVARFKDLKLTGDPDKDFADLMNAFYEEQLFVAKAQLEYGGDRQLRELAQRLQNEQQQRIDEIKQWRVRSQAAGYKAQPDQSPPGTGPLDKQAPQASSVAAAQASPPTAQQTSSPPAPAAAASAPLVSATVDDVNAAAGKVTLDHGAIPNLGMDAMTMVFRAAEPGMLKAVKKGDKVQFTADRVNGQLTVTKIQKAR